MESNGVYYADATFLAVHDMPMRKKLLNSWRINRW